MYACVCVSTQSFVETHEVKIPEQVYTGPGTGLFDFLASEMKTFIDKHHKRCGLPRQLGCQQAAHALP